MLRTLWFVSAFIMAIGIGIWNGTGVVARAQLEKSAPKATQPGKKEAEPKVTPIPEEVIKRYKLDTTFYKKHLDYKGFSILSSAKVSDEGLYEARYLIDKLLGEREDILKAMLKSGCRFMVMSPTEMTTDVPEQRHLKNDAKTNWDTRARGLGGKLSSCGEENLLNLKGDRYRQENILIHEFNHAIHQQGLRSVDPTFNGRLKKAYDNAKAKGLWKGTYVETNPAEYWAEGAQAYFDCMRPQFGANTREKLEKYDPDLFKLVDEVYKQSKYRYVRHDQRKKAEAKKDQPDPKVNQDKTEKDQKEKPKSNHLGSDKYGNPLRLAFKTGHVSNYDETKVKPYTGSSLAKVA